MRHDALPQNLTSEQLPGWLDDQQIDVKYYIEETPYDDDQIQELEHKSSVASRALDGLEELHNQFKSYLKDGCEEPISITIPPTKGQTILKANRKFADTEILRGYSETEIKLYGIPYAEKQSIMYFDAEGTLWDDHTVEMTPQQKEKYVGFLGSIPPPEDNSEMEEEVEDRESIAEEEDQEEAKMDIVKDDPIGR
jgi:hypothetical protein